MESAHYSVPICRYKHVDVDNLIHTLQQINLSQCAVHLQQEIAELDKLEDSLSQRKRRKESVEEGVHPDRIQDLSHCRNTSDNSAESNQRGKNENILNLEHKNGHSYSNTSNVYAGYIRSKNVNQSGKNENILNLEHNDRQNMEIADHRIEIRSPTKELFDCFMVVSSKNVGLEPQYCRKITEFSTSDGNATKRKTTTYSACECDDTDVEGSIGYDFDTTERKIFNQMRENSINATENCRSVPANQNSVFPNEADFLKSEENVDIGNREEYLGMECDKSIQLPICPDIINFADLDPHCGFTCQIIGCHAHNETYLSDKNEEHEKQVPWMRPLYAQRSGFRESEAPSVSYQENSATTKKIEELWRRFIYYCCIRCNTKRQFATTPPNPICSQPSTQLISHTTSSSSNIYQCNICEHKFANQSALTKHAREHHASVQLRPKYRCSDCPARFFASRMLVRHFRHQHTEQDDFRPPLCLQNNQPRGR